MQSKFVEGFGHRLAQTQGLEGLGCSAVGIGRTQKIPDSMHDRPRQHRAPQGHGLFARGSERGQHLFGRGRPASGELALQFGDADRRFQLSLPGSQHNFKLLPPVGHGHAAQAGIFLDGQQGLHLLQQDPQMFCLNPGNSGVCRGPWRLSKSRRRGGHGGEALGGGRGE